jgi:hypothetical protein
MQVPDHKRTLELIPWYVNGSLPDGERLKIERHLRTCVPCRSALVDEQRLRGLIREQAAIPHGPEHGVADLLHRIDGHGPVRSRLRFASPFVYAAAAGLALVVAFLLVRPFTEMAGQPDGEFSTLTNASDSAADRIDIVFDENLGPAEISVFIESLGGRLEAGPSELGRYTVSLPDASDRDLAALIADLGEDPRIRFVGRNFIAEPAATPEEP